MPTGATSLVAERFLSSIRGVPSGCYNLRMLDPQAPLDDNPESGATPASHTTWQAPYLDPRQALPPYSGYRTYPPSRWLPEEPIVLEVPPRRSRLASCLFVGVTAIVVFSLLATSSLAFFLMRRDAGRSQEQLQAAQSGRTEATQLDLRDGNAPVSDATAPPLPVAAAVGAMQTSPDAPELNRLVVTNSRGQLETMAPDGSDRRQLTQLSDGIIYQFPAWSPDGSAIAAIGTSNDGGGIFVFDDASGTSASRESSRYFSDTQLPIYLYWSPDSENLAFLANHSRSTFGLNVIPRTGTEESRVVATGSPLYWNWSEDSEALLLHSGDTGSQARLLAVDPNGVEQTPNLAQPGFFQAPGISPGGRYWTYAEAEGRGVSTLIVAHTATGERRLVEQAGSVAMTWSPTSEQLAYTSGGINAHPYWGPLRVVEAESGDTRLLTTDTVLAFFWSPDGRKVAYLTINGSRRDDYYAGDESRTQRVGRLATMPAQQGGSGFMSLSVVDVTTGRGLRLMDFQPTSVFATQFLPFFAQYALSHRLWSPDSESIVLPVRGDEGNVVMVVPVSGASPRAVAVGDMAFWSHR